MLTYVMLSTVCNVNRLSPTAVAPSRASAGAAGYDLSSSKDVIVPARGKAIVPTDISIALPEGTYGRVAPRSGLAWKNHIGILFTSCHLTIFLVILTILG